MSSVIVKRSVYRTRNYKFLQVLLKGTTRKKDQMTATVKIQVSRSEVPDTQ